MLDHGIFTHVALLGINVLVSMRYVRRQARGRQGQGPANMGSTRPGPGAPATDTVASGSARLRPMACGWVPRGKRQDALRSIPTYRP